MCILYGTDSQLLASLQVFPVIFSFFSTCAGDDWSSYYQADKLYSSLAGYPTIHLANHPSTLAFGMHSSILFVRMRAINRLPPPSKDVNEIHHGAKEVDRIGSHASTLWHEDWPPSCHHTLPAEVPALYHLQWNAGRRRVATSALLHMQLSDFFLISWNVHFCFSCSVNDKMSSIKYRSIQHIQYCLPALLPHDLNLHHNIYTGGCFTPFRRFETLIFSL